MLYQLRALAPKDMDAEETRFYNRDCYNCIYRISNEREYCQVGVCVKETKLKNKK